MVNIPKIDYSRKKLIVIGVVLFLVFTYLRFPVSAFRNHFENYFTSIFPESTVSIERLSTTLIPGVALRRIRVTSQREQRARYNIQKVSLRIAPTGLILRKASFPFQVASKEISMDGRLDVGILGRDYAALNLDFDPLDLTKLFSPGYLNDVLVSRWKQSLIRTSPQAGAMLSGMQLDGELRGDVALEGPKQTFKRGDLSGLDFNADIEAKKFAIRGLLGKIALRFGTLIADLQAIKGDFKKLEIRSKGGDIDLNVKGALKLPAGGKNGTINLEVRLQLSKKSAQSLSGSLNLILAPMGITLNNGKTAFRVTGVLGGSAIPRIVPL